MDLNCVGPTCLKSSSAAVCVCVCEREREREREKEISSFSTEPDHVQFKTSGYNYIYQFPNSDKCVSVSGKVHN